MRWEDYPRLSGWVLNAITSVLVRGRQREVTHISGDGREVGHNPAIRSWKRQGMGSPLQPLEEVWPC